MISGAKPENRSVNWNNIKVIKPEFSGVKAALINCRSVKNKSAAIIDPILISLP